MSERRTGYLFQKILLIGLVLHFLIGLVPLAKEARLVLRELPLLWGKSNEERRIIMLGGMLDAVEDCDFVAQCAREIPPDAEVLVISNSLANVYTLNYYLYPRKTSVDKENLGKDYWVVRYSSPKTLGTNRIERPGTHGSSD